MRKFIYLLTSFIVVLTCVFTFGACSDKTPDAIASQYDNVADGGKFSSDSGNAGDSVVFDFGKKVLINTVVLKEKGSNITSFRIYADGSDEPIYGNDFVDGYRYCTFAPVETTALKIEVLEADGKWKLTALEAYLILKEADDFEVMSYIEVDTAYKLSQGQAELAQYVTKFNVFGSVYFTAEGELMLVDYEIGGTKVNGSDILSGAIRNIRDANPAAKVLVTVLGGRDFGDGMAFTERHNSAMGEHSAALIENIIGLLDDYGLDGVSFDYEYPVKKKDFDTFSDFLASLDKALGDKLLTAAISDWSIYWQGFSAKDLEPLDAIELMAYDSFDERGNHSSFYVSCYGVLKNMEKKGVDLSKVNLGLPFYSRPENRDAYWGGYNDIAGIIGAYENSIREDYLTLDGKEGIGVLNYYNGRQLIYDKTRYAIDCGAGGVMIWHFGCDSEDPELSLFRQIAAAKKGEYII